MTFVTPVIEVVFGFSLIVFWAVEFVVGFLGFFAPLINIVSSSPIKNQQQSKTEKVPANRYHNEIIISSTDEIDDELTNWVKESYGLT